MNESLITLGIFVLVVFGTLYVLAKLITQVVQVISFKIASHSKLQMK